MVKGKTVNIKRRGCKVMNKKLLVLGIVGIAVLYVGAAIYAKETPPVIELQDPAYKEHTKGVVHFEHTKHYKEYAAKYPEFYNNGCGECHHDENNKPLSKLKEGDDVKKCIECHKIPGEMPAKLKKEMRAKKASKEEIKKKELEYHAEALHDNCQGCHREYNKKYKPQQKAPTTCVTCHPKSK
jgi:hypothetical protein